MYVCVSVMQSKWRQLAMLIAAETEVLKK